MPRHGIEQLQPSINPLHFSNYSLINAMGSLQETQLPEFEFLSKTTYIPPSWAAHLNPTPSHVFSLGHFPTPIHKWNLPNLPNNTEVYVKRDDLSGMQLSGNKVRKLEFLAAEAVVKGADCVITIGGVQSNHCRATAVAAKYLNLDCYLILRTSKDEVNKDPGLGGNLLVERLAGARIELVSEEDYYRIGRDELTNILKKKLLSEGRKPYVIPMGGSTSLATWGYIEAVREIQQQLITKGNVGATFDDIVVACGSGCTAAGLALGSRLSCLGAQVHAYSSWGDPDYFYDYAQGLLDGLEAALKATDILHIKDAKGLGYAINTKEELIFLKQIAEETGIILDPVYSGKAAYQMMRDMAADPTKWEGRKVLFIHTGGLLSLFDKADAVAPLLGNWRRMDIPG
ncbi:putative D-cysteine desulfhydrase 1, mitochondrial isoform X2 [Salvia miltiorrhiza]|uniref:putative D-cysteine desulfhydrase 1, mitochondrial isoform X2 n=1 Tax=Salvia miltiorrhiza TaxID=226208 RepID=UPI0025ACA778|nr:putative D-cysteine desulfhydrase 1, mitochondrial isoform X2 [Salvia miltiorrhiza]